MLVVCALGGCGSFGTAESRLDAGPSTGEQPPSESQDGGGGTTTGPVFDSASSGKTGDGSSVTFAHTVGPGPNRLLVVASHVASSTYWTERVTYGDRELVKVDPTMKVDPNEEDCSSTLFYLVDPPEGTAAVVAHLDKDASREITALAMSFHGVDPTTPLGKSGHMATPEDATGTGVTVLVESAPDELVVDSLCLPATKVEPVAAGPEQMVRVQSKIPSNKLFAFGSTAPGAPGRTMTWSFSSAPYSLHAVALRPAAP